MTLRPPRFTLFPYTTLFRSLGGFFMVRSYYPSECHADYFDFERIEALKPAKPLFRSDRKSGSAGMPRPISYAVFCLKKKKKTSNINIYNQDTATLYFRHDIKF